MRLVQTHLPMPSVVLACLYPLGEGTVQAPVFSHSGGCGAGNQTRATASWEPALAAGQRVKSGHWESKLERHWLPRTLGRGSGSEGGRKGIS